MGYIIVRILMNRGKLQVMIEKNDASPLTMTDCEKVSETLSLLIDHEEWIANYTELEVSSPGLDRPLTRTSDFERFAGSQVKIKSERPFPGGGRTLHGELLGIENNALLVKAPPPKKHNAQNLQDITSLFTPSESEPLEENQNPNHKKNYNAENGLWSLELHTLTSVQLQSEITFHDKGVELTQTSWQKECILMSQDNNPQTHTQEHAET
jgi:ribosome maturation factor RimP